jgi:hypothetical protein
VRGNRHRLLTFGVLAGVTALLGAAIPAHAVGGKDVAPEKWASSVCSALTEWGEALDAASGDLTESESPREATGVLEEALDATKALVKSVKKAGIPDVDGGAPTARTFLAAF